MGSLTAINHLLNFAAPALALALALVAGGHIFLRHLAKARGWIASIALLFVVGCGVLAGGVWWLGSDGRIATYTVLVVACASTYWLWLAAWR